MRLKSPIKKSSIGEPPREAFPTDSVTSSYGVGPTDENGRPLFGLSALRRRQSTHNNIQIPQDTVDTAPTDEREPEEKPLETRPTEVCDSSGRPLFGGLRALKATSTTVTNETSDSTTTTATSKSSIILNTTPRDRDRAPSIDDDKDMPEQPVTSHLRELVSKHEQHSRGNTVSQPNAPRQKPKAKLRDSFILQSKDTETDRRTEETTRNTRVVSQRAQSLKSIIQKHEKKPSDEPEREPDQEPSDDYPATDRSPGDVEISRRPGILKKPRDDVVTETTSTSSATFISSRGTVNADGKVSLTRDVIQGESVSRPGEEPVTKITRSKYIYNTPEDKDSPAICYDKDDYDQTNTTRKSSTSSRRSSSGKTPSPERNYPDDKPSKTTTSSVTSSNSIRRSRVSEDERKSSFTSKYDKFSSTSPHDDTSRRPKGPVDKATDDKKFVSSTTTVLSSRQKTTDDNDIRRTRSSPDRGSIVDTDYEPEHSTQRTEKYTSSTTTQRTTGKTPDSVRRQIFTDGGDEEIDVDCMRRTSGSNYGKYSSSTTVSRTATSNLLDSERRGSSGIRGSGDDRRSPLNGQQPDYDDESDGYKTTSRYVSRTITEDTPRSTRRYSNDIETEEHSQRSEVHYSSSSSSVTQSRTVGGTSTTLVESKSTPNQITGVGRRRSSTNVDGDRESSPTPSTGSTGFSSKLTRGGSVRALSQKFQQAAGSTNVKESMEVRSSSTHSTQGTPQAENEGKSFLTNQTRVTGVQDVLTRMRNADQEVQSEDTEEDAEARALLNKFLGAQVILQGMEPLVKGSQTQSAALVSQVERQRMLSSQKTTTISTNSKNLEQDLEDIWDERVLRQLLDKCTDYEGRRLIRARLRVVMAEQKACAGVVAAALADEELASQQEQEDGGEVLRHSVEEGHSESKTTSSSTDGSTVTRTEVSTKTSSFSATAVGKSKVSKAPLGKAMSPFAKFQQLDRQSSSQSAPSSPKTPGGTTAAPLFKFTDPKLSRSASGVKDKLLFWCQSKTKEYKNIQIDNFSTCWSNGLAFCALIHHFLPDAFDYDSLKPEERRKNFELAFRVADEKAGIAPLLDVEDMVMMRKPDWKCVFTYVQSVYRRFRDED